MTYRHSFFSTDRVARIELTKFAYETATNKRTGIFEADVVDCEEDVLDCLEDGVLVLAVIPQLFILSN